MTDQERKERILTKLRNIVFLLLGITVVFISIASIVSNTAFGNIVSKKRPFCFIPERIFSFRNKTEGTLFCFYLS